jgi:hypothetical protein
MWGTETSWPTGNRIQAIQPVARRYTDWVILTPWKCGNVEILEAKLMNQNVIVEEIKSKFIGSYHHLVQNLLSSYLLSKNVNIKI